MFDIILNVKQIGMDVDKLYVSLLIQLDPKWGTILQICDYIQEEPTRIYKVLESVNLRLQEGLLARNSQYFLNTLHMIDVIIKNSRETILLIILSDLTSYKILIELLTNSINKSCTVKLAEFLKEWTQIFKSIRNIDNIIQYRIESLEEIVRNLCPQPIRVKPPISHKPTVPRKPLVISEKPQLNPAPNPRPSAPSINLIDDHHLVRPVSAGSSQCVICQRNELQYACDPCCHKCLCSECFKFNRDRAVGMSRCPRCQMVIERFFRVFE